MLPYSHTRVSVKAVRFYRSTSQGSLCLVDVPTGRMGEAALL